MKLEISASPISGYGSFAKKKIARGEFILTLSGEPFSDAEAIQECIKRGLSHDDSLQIGDGLFLILNDESRLINHSCDPNCGVRNRSDLYALKDIECNEEVTYDYATTVGRQTSTNIQLFHMPCRCGAENCRQLIQDVFSIPNERRLEYAHMRAFPDFIKDQLTQYCHPDPEQSEGEGSWQKR